MTTPRFRLWFFISFSCQLWVSPIAGQGRVDQIAIEQQASPDGNGAFRQIAGTGINDAGLVPLFVALSGTAGGQTDDGGVYTGDGDNISQIAREGENRPGGNGTFVDAFSNININDGGQILFDNKGFGNSANSAIFRVTNFAIEQIAAEGQIFPGTGEAISSVASKGINNSGSVAYRAGTPGLSSVNHRGLFVSNAFGSSLVARNRQPSPDGNGTIAFLSYVAINDEDQVLFSAILGNTNGGNTDDFGFYYGSGGAITQVLRESQAAPDGNGIFLPPAGIRFNNAGQVVFAGQLSGTSGGNADNSGIYIFESGAISKLIDEGQAAPNGNGIFSAPASAFLLTGLNNSGRFSFHASLTGTTGGADDADGIFTSDTSGAITQMARNGQMTSDGTLEISQFPPASLNDSGQVVFSASLQNTIAGSLNNSGIFIGDGIDLQEVVRKGDSFDGSAIASTFGFFLNDAGQVLYNADLADGRTIVNRWTPNLHWRANSTGDWNERTNWTLGLAPATIHDVFVDPASNLTVHGPTADTTVRTLQVGGGTGDVIVNFLDNVVLTVTDGITIKSNGTLTGKNVPADVNNEGFIQIGLGETTDFTSDIKQNGDLEIPPASMVQVYGRFSGGRGFFGGGRLRLFGQFSLGNSPASVLFDGDLELDSAVVTEIELAGLAVGEFDQMQVAGNLDLAGTLEVSLLDGYEIEDNQRYLIGKIDGILSGQFDMLSEGQLVGNFGGTDLFITYQGGDGNDIVLFTQVLGDFDNDGDADADDIDSYSGTLGQPAIGTFADFDLDKNGAVELADLTIHVEQLVQTSNGQTGTFFGDANLDGTVDVLGDAFILVGNLGSFGGWADGDFSADGTIDVLGDAFVLVGNLGKSN